uniref:Uncharacterized protein n=1 Tax=Klebsiella oxytoca TaxID=571 RepID=A0A1Z3MN01_KLEOX|nr:hypothetical protein [Klebsiella oxytoca]
MERLYLVLQSQILELFEAGKSEGGNDRTGFIKEVVSRFSDRRMNSWARSHVPLGLTKEHELRTWADLRLLAEFLKR